MDSVERLLWWLFGSSIGASTRARVVRAINENPRNAQQIAQALGVDYTTVRHHLRVLQENRLVETAGERYGMTYFLSPTLESHWEVFEKIVAKMESKKERVADA